MICIVRSLAGGGKTLILLRRPRFSELRQSGGRRISRDPWKWSPISRGVGQSTKRLGPRHPQISPLSPSLLSIRVRRTLRRLQTLGSPFCTVGHTHHCRNLTEPTRPRYLCTAAKRMSNGHILPDGEPFSLPRVKVTGEVLLSPKKFRIEADCPWN